MSRFLNVFVKLIIIFICHQVLATNAETPRIVGGSATNINRNKYLVSLRTKSGGFFCGGSLVRKRFVVTAAHCVEGLTAADFNVHGGVSYITRKGVERSVVQIVKPQAFNMRNFTMDVAILKLSAPMQGRNIATIPLCSHTLRPNNVVKVAGWGLTNEFATNPVRRLRSTRVRMISKRSCRQQYRNTGALSRTMMCASVPGVRDSCSGDSGGPLVHRGQLCGIVSFGVGCARRQYPGVYTNVNSVKGFILRAIRRMS